MDEPIGSFSPVQVDTCHKQHKTRNIALDSGGIFQFDAFKSRQRVTRLNFVVKVLLGGGGSLACIADCGNLKSTRFDFPCSVGYRSSLP